MKKLFLLRSIRPAAGKTMLDFVPAPAVDGLNDFQSGDRDNVIRIDVYGDASAYKQGVAYTLSIDKYDPNAQAAAAPADVAEATEDNLKEILSFEGKVTFKVDPDKIGCCIISVEPVGEVTNLEEPSDTQALPADNSENAGNTATGNDSTSKAEDSQASGGDSINPQPGPDTITGDNKEVAAVSESETDSAGAVADNTGNNAESLV